MIPVVDGSYIRTDMPRAVSLVAYTYATSDCMDTGCSICVVQRTSSIVVVVCVFWWIVSSKVIVTLNVAMSVNKNFDQLNLFFTW